ncbi:MAG: tetratricopeptide repeat protein [Candidatus Odinarchaeota archaeon]
MIVKTLNGKILVVFLGTLLIGIIAMVSFSAAGMISFSQSAASKSEEIILQEELLNLDRLAKDKAIVINEYFVEIISEANFMTDYATDLFNGKINAEPVKSYFGDADAGPGLENPPMVYSELHKLEVSYEASAWWQFGLENINNVPSSVMQQVNQSSNLDYVFKILFDQNPLYLWTYMGFSTGFHRTYPYKDLSTWWNLSYSNARSGGKYVGQYDPRLRQWYVDGETAGKLSISKPDIDPTLKILKVGFSSPVYYDNGSLVGVITADLTIDVIEQTVNELQILDTGYAFMIDTDENAIVHHSIDRSKESQLITELEFTSNKNEEITEFYPVLKEMTDLKEGNSSYMKNGEKWYISYYPVPDAGFSLALAVSESDILAPANKIRDEIMMNLFLSLGLFLVIILVVSAGIFVFVNYTSRKIIDPVKELTEVSRLIAGGNLSRDLKGNGRGSKEISVLYSTFKGLITALRFGNENYYAGNINRAMSNYKNALELFITLDNSKGVGICYNNIGNIHRIRGNLKDANIAYRKAIDIGFELLKDSTGSERMDHLVALASRHNNVGLLYTAIEEYEKAEEYLRKALEFDREIDNTRGFTTRYGNLGQLYIAQGRFQEAKEAFEEAHSIALTQNSDRALAYSIMNLGIYEKALGNYSTAREHFLTATQKAENLDIRVVISSLTNLRQIYEEEHEWHNVKKIEEQLAKINEKNKRPKEVTFILDYSGSMAGRRIKAAREGMKKIFKNQVKNQDLVSLIIFNHQSSVLIPLVGKEGNEERITKRMESLRYPESITAFYDALEAGFTNFERNPSPNERWMIVLTDGDDNSSTTRLYDVVKMAKRAMGVNLVIIGVGNLRDREQLEKMCYETERGKYIDIDDKDGVADSISEAFEEVSTMLAEVEVEGFVPDY